MWKPGARVDDRYEVVRRLGEGGMADVYEARDHATGRRVAIKVLKPDCAADPSVVTRFEREARAAATIGHPNVVEVLGYGTHAGGPYMVMEFLDGETLSARIERQGRLAVGAAVHVATQVLSALAAAHAAGIVHRDLKPDNVVLLARDGRADVVKLLDFGISKFRPEPGAPEPKLTKSGALLGTPYYMAPEQALARRDVDHRADLYAVGVLLYEMLTGVRPFEGVSVSELCVAIAYRPRGLTAPRAHRPELPEALEAEVLRALSQDREARHADAAEFLAALAPFGEPAPRGAGAPVRGAAGLVGAGVLAGGALVAGLWLAGTRGAGHGPPTLAAPPAPAARPAAVATARVVAVELDGVPAEARIEVDGRPAASPRFEFVRGSRHRIRVTAPGRAPFQTDVDADRDRSIVVALAPAAPAAATATTAASAELPPAPARAAAAPDAEAPARHRPPGATPHAPTRGGPPPGPPPQGTSLGLPGLNVRWN